VAQDLIQSGLDFSLIYVADEDMGAAVIRMLTDKGVINKPYKVLSENGSPAGIPLLKDGRLKFTVSMSPGWEGLLAFLALQRYVVGASSKVNQAIMMPIVGITKDNINQIAPWEYDPVWWDFTKQYHPDLLKF
jgi:ribose transport system substrate-binding protein